jgi:hypothetical protein
MNNYSGNVGYTPIIINNAIETPYLQYMLYREAIADVLDQPGSLSKPFPDEEGKKPFSGIAFRVSFMFTDLLNKFSSITGDTLSTLWKPTLTIIPANGSKTVIDIGWDVDSDEFALVKAGKTKPISIAKPYTLYTKVYSKAALDQVLTGPLYFSLEKSSSSSYNGVGIGVLGCHALLRKGF